MKKIFLLLAGITFNAPLFSQVILPLRPEVARAIEKGTRTLSGRPGKSYWQNTADYKIRVRFDPLTRELSGTADIVYQNNSPDTLREAVFKLYPNLYQKGAQKATRIAPADQNEGVSITKLLVNGAIGIPEMDGTNMMLPIPRLLPGKMIRFSVTYSYIVNKGSHIRTGQVDDGSWFIAYFFPRVAVYDDVDGWDRFPYRGSEEFYNDFCNFDTEISMPAGYVVWATGNLENASEVFNKAMIGRIAKAESSDEVTDVITPDDLESRAVTVPGAHTWKFSASNVTDFVFAVSNHYVWKSSSLVVDPETGRRTRVDAVFNPAHKDYHEVIDFARKTVEQMSFSFPKWPFPYAHETVFDGLDQMEYPMMVNDNPTKTRQDAITLTSHEIFHTLFPFYMGINETRYGWMDEGWATIGEWIISKAIDPDYTDEYGVEATANSAGKPGEQPVMTVTPELKGMGAFTNTYPKPAMGYLYVKDLLGDDLFTKALHHYIKLWNGKHPVPSDFFNAMNEGAGVDLNWFWYRWFYENGGADQAIGSVLENAGRYEVRVDNTGGKPMPVDLTVNYQDGSSRQIHRSVAVWEKNRASVTVSFDALKPVKNIVLGSVYVPDSNKDNNIWTK
jgi:hypothetical protein